MEKNLDLLHPFDLEAAKRGDEICYKADEKPVKFVTHLSETDFIVEHEAGDRAIVYYTHLRMAPLCWVEGRPVYKGDRLYREVCKGFVEASCIRTQGDFHFLCYKKPSHGNSAVLGEGVADLSWEAPKQKREGWINIYKGDWCSTVIYPDEQIANSSPHRLAHAEFVCCIRIEWEEQP